MTSTSYAPLTGSTSLTLAETAPVSSLRHTSRHVRPFVVLIAIDARSARVFLNSFARMVRLVMTLAPSTLKTISPGRFGPGCHWRRSFAFCVLTASPISAGGPRAIPGRTS